MSYFPDLPLRAYVIIIPTYSRVPFKFRFPHARSFTTAHIPGLISVKSILLKNAPDVAKIILLPYLSPVLREPAYQRRLYLPQAYSHLICAVIFWAHITGSCCGFGCSPVSISSAIPGSSVNTVSPVIFKRRNKILPLS